MVWVRPLLLVLGLVAAGAVMKWLGLDAALAHLGERGPLLYVLLGSAACAVGVPRQVIAYAGGLGFGFWPGVALAMACEMAGCAADFWWARLLGRRWASRWLSGAGRLGRLDRFLVGNTFRATLTLRLLPVGSNMVFNLVAGVSGLAAGPFMAASALGYLPQTVIFSLLGSGVAVSDGVRLGVAGALFAVSAGLGYALLRRRGAAA